MIMNSPRRVRPVADRMGDYGEVPGLGEADGAESEGGLIVRAGNDIGPCVC